MSKSLCWKKMSGHIVAICYPVLEIEVDEGESALEGNENKRTVLEKNEVIVLENSEEENKKISEVLANGAPTAYEEIKIYISQSTTFD
ncbi:42875_t:CDS:2 [Gigaspora margarita]|uniref:42875_t:CDS:1 n=1 Tax=Gigaspora margarita TaxID=4874 RepID=A0ABN7VX47_GIGMA|nr:42875_t:CDS:2 [Gigaspora margarita]